MNTKADQGNFVVLLFVFLFVLSALWHPADARPTGGWRLLGERTVRDTTDRDVIWVRGSREYDEIRICVDRAAVNFKHVDIRFRNGGNQDVVLRKVIPAGDCTRNIKLRFGERNINRVIFVYEALTPGVKRSHVRISAR